VIDVGPIRRDRISNDSLALVVTIRLDGDFFPEGDVSDGVLRSLAVSLAFSVHQQNEQKQYVIMKRRCKK
jgi:hypothetical protein